MKAFTGLFGAVAGWQSSANGGKFADRSAEDLQRMMGGLPYVARSELISFYKHHSSQRKFSIE